MKLILFLFTVLLLGYVQSSCLQDRNFKIDGMSINPECSVIDPNLYNTVQCREDTCVCITENGQPMGEEWPKNNMWVKTEKKTYIHTCTQNHNLTTTEIYINAPTHARPKIGVNSISRPPKIDHDSQRKYRMEALLEEYYRDAKKYKKKLVKLENDIKKLKKELKNMN